MIPATTSMDRVRPRRRDRRALVTLLGLGALLALSLPWLVPSVTRWASAQEAVPLARLRIGEVRRGPLVRDVSVEGRLRAAEHPTLFAPVPGIVDLDVREGEVVTAGQVLAVVASPELQNRRAQEVSRHQALGSELGRLRITAREEVLTNQQAIDLFEVRMQAAERGLERAEESLRQGIISDSEHEKARDELTIVTLELEHAREKAELRKESLDFEVQQKEQELERQQLVVDEVERLVEELAIRAPFEGLVASLVVEDRDAVLANQALLTVVDLGSFEVEIRIPETYADDVVAGTRAEVLVDGEAHPGLVVRVAPEVTGSQVLGTVAFDGDEPTGLRQSQRVSARLILEEKADVLKVPRGPFLESGGGRTVWCVADGLARRTEVEVGAISITEVEIASGLAEGDRIVLSDMTLYGDLETLLLVD